MNSLVTTAFFDLTHFAHAKLFDGCTYVWQALANISAYLRAYKLGKFDSKKHEFAYLVNPELISIGEGSVVEPGAYIKGPCIIGKGCHIRHGAYIRGDCIIGDECVIGHTTEMKASIILNHSNAAHFAYLGDTIVGSHVNLGAGVKCANLRLDGKPIVIRMGEQKIETGMRKFGAIIGDYAEVGCNSVLNPGTLLGKYVHAYPCCSFGGYVADKSLIKPAAKVTIEKLS